MADRKIMQLTVLSAVLAGLIAIGAWLRIELPFSPVPITLQTLFVLLAGLLLPPALGRSLRGGCTFLRALSGYRCSRGELGALPSLWGRAGGFSSGFYSRQSLLCPCSVPCSESGERPGATPIFYGDLIALLAGTLIIYACGLSLDCAESGLGMAHRSCKGGFFPICRGDILKILAAALLAFPARKIILRDA